MDYAKLASQIFENLGGSENITSISHCATRLRLVLADDAKFNKSALEGLDGVKGCFYNSGQHQIIIGAGAVDKVYAAMTGSGTIVESSTEDQKKAASQKLSWFQRFARMLSNIFVPIIPVIVASGLLMGTLGLLTNFNIISADSGILSLLNLFSNAAFVFLPVLIAFSAAKEFGTNPYLAAVLGAIMIHPDLQNAWTLGDGVKNYSEILGMNVAMVGYQGTVLPVLIAIFVMAHIEKFIKKRMPNALDLLLTPFLTLLFTGFLTFFVIGPVGRGIGDGISVGLLYLYQNLGIGAGLLFGGLYSLIVITGMHHSFHAVETGLLANPAIGINFLLPIWSMANVAQGGAALAAGLRSGDQKLRSVAYPAGLSCLLGITEAAIFGVNLRLVRPFIAAALGGAVGGGFMVMMNVGMSGIGVTGIPGIAMAGNSMLYYILGMVLAFVTAFVLSFILYKPATTEG